MDFKRKTEVKNQKVKSFWPSTKIDSLIKLFIVLFFWNSREGHMTSHGMLRFKRHYYNKRQPSLTFSLTKNKATIVSVGKVSCLIIVLPAIV